MLLLIHITLALLSLIMSTLALLRPSQAKLRSNGVLAVATLASGTFLTLRTHAALVSACASGLVYLIVVLALNGSAYCRLVLSKR